MGTTPKFPKSPKSAVPVTVTEINLEDWFNTPVEPTPIIATASNEWTTKADFAAEMTNRQFAALGVRLNHGQLSKELTTQILPGPAPKPAKNYREDEVRKWATNGWNTECILRLTPRLLPGEQLENALQWAFPQAYYSAFALILALYKTTGQTETTHTAVLYRFGEQVATAGYPPCLTFSATGVDPITFDGVAKVPGLSSLAFDPNDPKSVNHQIAQFLKGTREKDLQERKKKMSFKTRGGKRKKKLTTDERKKVSENLGRTSVLSLLYRKRIKSNYGDIDTFLNSNITAAPLFQNLIHVVNCLNFTHEVTIARAIGLTAYAQLQTQLKPVPEFLKSRTAELTEMLAKQ
jgi:hypothetical protein